MKAAPTVTGIFLFAALAARPAYPCLNEVMRQEEAIKMVTKVEQALEIADYNAAEVAMRTHKRIHDDKIEDRLADARKLIFLRTRTDKTEREQLALVADHFKVRAKGKDVKFKAWLAESYEALGKTEDALAILDDLKKRDLVPDAFAYMSYARLTAKAADRDAAVAACKVRAKNKAICVLPANVAKS
ncbi:MAG: hypothetical protein KF773_23180 [Deltaproteobacteria bacterium]|nr:hypothetical protein [Deltaproteobacteria bacterium]